MNVLSLNLGSSSLKYAVHAVEEDTARRLFSHDVPATPKVEDAAFAARSAVDEAKRAVGQIDAIGYRVVFGGAHDAPARVTPEIIAELQSLQSLDPLHGPGALAVIRAAQSALPDRPHVACFDTAFFHDVPQVARVLPIPSTDPVLRRYGFHGLSYEYVCRALGTNLKPRTIAAHLGNGASVAAFRDGKPVATSMAFSPLSGVVMSTRPGDLDPGVLLYLLERSGYTVPQLRGMLETQSGLRALSAGESDMRKLCERSDDAARLAVESFVRSVSMTIAALATDLGGIDLLVFTGGIGAHNAWIRERIAARLAFLQPVHAIEALETDENLMVASHTASAARSSSESITAD